jgi:hypothetical protein
MVQNKKSAEVSLFSPEYIPIFLVGPKICAVAFHCLLGNVGAVDDK